MTVGLISAPQRKTLQAAWSSYLGDRGSRCGPTFTGIVDALRVTSGTLRTWSRILC